jgi:MFS transporter, ACS family, solute carrier family 17 (sodium-dependent inorganic phosphate cotransporter), other
MPSYYATVLGFDLASAGLAAVYPWLCMAVMANIGGWIADNMVQRGFSRTLVRKVMQTIGFMGPAFFLTQLQHISDPVSAVLCMCACQGLDAFSQSGLYSNHQVRHLRLCWASAGIYASAKRISLSQPQTIRVQE